MAACLKAKRSCGGLAETQRINAGYLLTIIHLQELNYVSYVPSSHPGASAPMCLRAHTRDCGGIGDQHTC